MKNNSIWNKIKKGAYKVLNPLISVLAKRELHQMG